MRSVSGTGRGFGSPARTQILTLAAIYVLDRVVEMITLDNIEQFTIPLQDHSAKWIFETGNKQLPSAEHLDQIFPLTEEASRFLWDFQSKIRINSFYPDVNKYFRDVEKFTFGENMESQVKKWLYQRGLPFKDNVFISFQPNWGLVLTWKMVIHYSSALFFGYDLTVWDRTINWGLYFHHDDIFHFGRNRIYDGQEEQRKLNQLIRGINMGGVKI